MKTLILSILICIAHYNVRAQISLQMRTGWVIKTNEPIISPAIHFATHGFALNPEMIVTFKDDSPAYFGLKISYEYVVRDELSIEGGYGRYFSMFTMDKYDSYKNGWKNDLFIGVHLKNFFIQYDYLNGSSVSIGFRETIGKVQ